MLKFDKRNFDEEALKTLWRLTNAAEFIALDCEFSCVRPDPAKVGRASSQDEVYRGYKALVEKACLLDVGITFILEGADHQKEAVTCSFHVFKGDGTGKSIFNADKECLHFLAHSNFDFNSCFKHGLQYSLPEEDLNFLFPLLAVGRLEESRIDLLPFTKAYYLSQAADQTEKDACGQLSEFMATPNFFHLKIPVSDSDHLKLLTSIDSEFIRQAAAANLKLTKKDSCITLEKKSHTGHFLEQPFQKYGLSLLFWAFGVKKKKLILHHGLLDYMYIFSNLVAPLPETLEEFQKASTQLHWEIFDTKLIAQREARNLSHKDSNDLSKLYAHWLLREDKLKTMRFATQNYFSDLANLFGHITYFDASNPQSHGAGPDSYMTAMAFLAMRDHIPALIPRYEGQFWDKFNWRARSFSVTSSPAIGCFAILTFNEASAFDKILELLREISSFSVRKEPDGSHRVIFHKYFSEPPPQIAEISSLANIVYMHRS